MNRRVLPLLLLAGVAAGALSLVSCTGMNKGAGTPAAAAAAPAGDLLAQGRQIFRFDTFGDEAFWTEQLRMVEPLSTLTPKKALEVGLKVDAEAVPPAVAEGVKSGKISLDDPKTTLALLKLNAVVGVKGTVETVGGQERLTRVGITCALCHSTVDNSFMPGIGKRLDGWPNRDLNPGAIIALSPALDAAKKAAYNSWGKGMYDARFNLDGASKPTVIPPAYGLAGIPRHTFTGDGNDIAYWNRYVSVTQMGGMGSFSEPRTGVNVTHGTVDMVSAKLPALQAYQYSLPAPRPPAGSFDPAAAERGRALFSGKATCVTCHTGPTFTDAAQRLHPPADSVVEPERPSYASRSATKLYRVSPLHGLWQHAPYFHDGSAATLEDVVARYNQRRNLQLSQQEARDLAQFLRSL